LGRNDADAPTLTVDILLMNPPKTPEATKRINYVTGRRRLGQYPTGSGQQGIVHERAVGVGIEGDLRPVGQMADSESVLRVAVAGKIRPTRINMSADLEVA
jgi:hypothetical protein